MIMLSRAAVSVTAASAALLAALVLTGCGAVDKAISCGKTAATIANDVQQLQETVSGSADSPQDAADALARIDRDLQSLDDDTGDADVSKAASSLQQAVENARATAEKGTVPDIAPVADAATELSKVCAT
jgi:glycerate kinase